MMIPFPSLKGADKRFRAEIPLVSVCIPAYNHERYVERAIRSVIAQTYKRIELIIIDDGSKDKTWDVMQNLKGECEARFERVVFETQQNCGTCITTNRLVSIAAGEFFFLIASDDELLPMATETLLSEFRSDDCVLSVGDNYLIDGDSNRIAWDEERRGVPLGKGAYKTFWEFFSKNLSEGPTPTEFGSYASLVRSNYIPNGYLIRRSAFLMFGGCSSEAPLEDWYIMLQLSKLGQFAFVDKPLFNYRWHDSNTSLDNSHMVDISRRTLQFEERLLISSHDKVRLRYFREYSPLRRKAIVKIPFVFSIEDCRDFGQKYRVLTFIGHQFILRKPKKI